MKNAIKIILSVVGITAAIIAFAAERTQIMIDEYGDIQPAAARSLVTAMTSAAVKIDLAEARLNAMQSLVTNVNEELDKASEALTKINDFCLVEVYATGLGDVDTSVGSAGEIKIVDIKIDRTNDVSNILVDLTWRYIDGSFSSPEIIASTSLTNSSSFAAVAMSTPVQVAWGSTVAYTARATLPKSSFSSTAFFKVRATLNTPIDDGRVFDIYSSEGGISSTVNFTPSRNYKITFTAGRVTGIEVVP